MQKSLTSLTCDVQGLRVLTFTNQVTSFALHNGIVLLTTYVADDVLVWVVGEYELLVQEPTVGNFRRISVRHAQKFRVRPLDQHVIIWYDTHAHLEGRKQYEIKEDGKPGDDRLAL